MPRITQMLLAALLLSPLAQAQGTLTSPIQGTYTDVYVLSGRIVDALGQPVVGGELRIELDQKGITAKPLDAKSDCFGVFITYFDLKHVDPAGVARITLKGTNGGPDAHESVSLDPFWRRSDVNITYQGQWSSVCPDQTNLFSQRVSVSGRILNRTETYQSGSESYEARPQAGYVRLRYWPTNSSSECPPADQPGYCDPVNIDERGDFRYSWVAPNPRDATGHVEVIWANETRQNFTVDQTFRYALAFVETSGRGPPPQSKPSPGPDSVLLLGVVGALALIVARRRRGAA
ncbi:MAG: hypothetical protein WDA16_01020 [Candidatus Thermoplasmatota archaeon]